MVDGAHLLVLGAKEVEQCLQSISVDDLVRNQADVFATFSTTSANERWESPLRIAVRTSQHTHLFMPSRLEERATIKCVAVPRPESGSAPPGLPGIGLSFDEKMGRANVVINVSQLTAVRTAAGCLAASIAMQPRRTPETTRGGRLVVFGTGNQARWHVRLFVEYYQLTHVVVVSRDAQRVQTSLFEVRKDVSIDVVQQGSEQVDRALSQTDFVCGCTPSSEALFAYENVGWKSSVHFSLIGSYKPHMQEVPVEVVDRAAREGALMVDSIEACSHEAGDLLKSSTSKQDWVEIGQLLTHDERNKNRIDVSDRFSLFKSVGFALQDSAVITLIVDYARKKNIGQSVPFF